MGKNYGYELTDLSKKQLLQLFKSNEEALDLNKKGIIGIQNENEEIKRILSDLETTEFTKMFR